MIPVRVAQERNTRGAVDFTRLSAPIRGLHRMVTTLQELAQDLTRAAAAASEELKRPSPKIQNHEAPQSARPAPPANVDAPKPPRSEPISRAHLRVVQTKSRSRFG